MRLKITQHFPAPVADVQAALVDPAYLERLAELPKLGRPELLEQSRDGDVVRQRVRYRFAGDLNAAVRRVVDPNRLTWVEVAAVDVAAAITTWHIEPDHYAHLLHASGTFTLLANGPDCRRDATIELKVSVPLAGSRVERAIASGLREHAEREETAMAAWLGQRSG